LTANPGIKESGGWKKAVRATLKAKHAHFMGCLSWAFILLAVPLISSPLQEKEITGFLGRLQDALKAKNFDGYIQSYEPGLRNGELTQIRRIFQEFQIEDVTITRTFTQSEKDGGVQLGARVFYENPHTVLLENWRLRIEKAKGTWSVVSKERLGNTIRLYKIHIPGGAWQRVRRIEVRHTDLTLTFQDALVFYDSLPELQTALLILGKGHVRFSPSPSREKHQLELLFKKRTLDETLEYAYLRFSPTFFSQNITIVPDSNLGIDPPESVKNQAYSLFSKHYPRSFTIEHSGDTRYLSTLPRGDEVVFDFKSRRYGLFTYIYSPFVEEEVHLFQWKGGRLVNMYSPADNDPSQKRLFVSAGRSFDVLNYDLDVDFYPPEYFFHGKARIRVQAKFGSRERVRLKLNSQFRILGVYGENHEKLYYSQDKLRDNLYIYFIEPPAEGDQLSFEIQYEGRIETQSRPEEGLMIPRVVDTAAFRLPQYQTYLYTRRDYWYPAPPHDDYFNAKMTVALPKGHTVVATGKLVGTREVSGIGGQVEGEYRAFDFDAALPVKYLAFIAGRLSKVAEEESPINVQYFRDEEFGSQLWDVFEETKRIYRFYTSLFGPCPYEKISVVQRLWDHGGGNSPPSFVVLNELPRASRGSGLVPALSPIDLRRWSEFFLAHEIAHQWWGQGISWDTYHDLWLSEGISQFAAISYLRHKYGERAYAFILKKFSKWTEKKSYWGSISMGTRLSHLDFEAYQTIIYNKAALALNMLQNILGKDRFQETLKRFYKNHKYKTVRSAAFFRAFQEVGGPDMSLFFNAWFESYLLPDIDVSRNVQKTETGCRLEVVVEQRKGLFVFPLVLEWEEGNRRVVKRVIIRQKKESFAFNCGGKGM